MRRDFELIISIDTNFKYQAINKIKELGFNLVSCKCLEKRRTSQANRALHLWFTLLAVELNDKHFNVKSILKEGIEVEWTPILIKEIM